jgi:hypothetical protein
VFSGHSPKPFLVNKADFALFAAFYVASQGIERLLELFAALWQSLVNDVKADRTLIGIALGTLLGAGGSLVFGLYGMEAVGAISRGSNSSVPHWQRFCDVVTTALVLAAGTKALHDLIQTISAVKGQQQQNEQAAAQSNVSG